jgi:ABC-2 type transport system permease protein
MSAAAVLTPVEPAHGLTHELRAVRIVWWRDLQRARNDPMRMVGSLLQPFLLLFVLGKGLGAVGGPIGAGGGAGAGDGDFATFLFPGTVVTGVMFPAVFSAISIVWDREAGFLREMLVAPISRGSIVAGKCLGGATVALANGVVLLGLAPLAGVPYRMDLLLGALGIVFLAALAMTASALALAVRVHSVQTLMPLVQLLLTPLMFLSGALFPAGGNIPTWLAVTTRLNPVSYAVDGLQEVVFPAVNRPTSGGLTWWGWPVPLAIDLAVLGATASLLLALAMTLFTRAE